MIFFHLKMRLPNCVLVSVLLMIADGFIVKGPSDPLVAPLGSSVVLSCYVDTPLLMEGLEVEWRRTDSETLVHLYQDGESRPEVQQKDYHDRAHFFTHQIQHGNFSLRLDNLRAEDEGEYTCKVYSQQDSGETVVQIKDVERLLVSGSSRSISAYVGQDITLNCSVDSHITPEHIEELSWKKTGKDGDILVMLYQNNEIIPDSSDGQYRDRVKFFTDEIPKGNFSLRLKSVRTEDKGVYMCQVFAGDLSASATVVLERLGFSGLHIMVLILCISASGSALLLCCLIYCTSQYKGLTVHSCSGSLVPPSGSSVILPCHVDKYLLMEGLKVEWRRTDSETLVHLYQDGESRPESQHQDYHDRAHFFTDQIQHGNFSLRLDNLTAEDEGKYTCKVYSQENCYNVKHSNHTVVPLGSSLVLPCYVDEHLIMKDLEVEWRRIDSEFIWRREKNTLVHLYPDGESRPENQHQDYHDRAHFFTDQIQHGNFSLRLDNLRAEDEGEYICTVYSQQDSVFSASTNLELRLLDTIFRLQMFLVFGPNMIMFFAFVLWGLSEGSLFETVSCSALYFLRPLMLLWAAPYVNEFTGNIKTFIKCYSFRAEYIVFSTVFYSVLFKSVLEKILYNAGSDVVIIVLFVIVLLLNLIYIIFLLTIANDKGHWINDIFGVLAGISFDVLPSLQFILLFWAFGSAREGFYIFAILPIFLKLTRYNWDLTFGVEQMGCSPLVRRSVWLIFIFSVNAIIVYFYIISLENEKDRMGWACMISFLQLLWAVLNFIESFQWVFQMFQYLHCTALVYLFGSVGVVLLNSVALMTELTMKTVNGYGVVGDLRVFVFSSEFLFTFSLLILLVFQPWMKTFLDSCQGMLNFPVFLVLMERLFKAT
ncbi:uncharacterized protein [Pseudorasbora parva]|uniref:uncharacterized protein n=1 Tax=Pseudorasbora parva TaxID=51549 RepID=UPI00351F5E56